MPEWRIIDDATWQAVQARLAAKAKPVMRPAGPASKFPLSGIARCGKCGGAIGSMRAKRGTQVIPAYGCTWHNMRGNDVCSVTVRQAMDEVHAVLAAHLQATILAPAMLEQVVAAIRAEAQRQLAAPATDCGDLETELRELRAQQRRLTDAVVRGAGDVPEIVDALKTHNERIRAVEADLAAVKRTPALLAEVVAKVEAAAVAKLVEVRAALAGDPAAAREIYKVMFPAGLTFTPEEVGRRHVWKVEGLASLNEFILQSDPKGSPMFVSWTAA